MLREIELKTCPPFQPNGPEVTYFDLMKSIVESGPTDGVPVSYMRKAFKVVKALETAKEGLSGKVFFTEEEWQFLKERTLAMKWLFTHQVFVDIEDAVVGAAQVDPNKVPREPNEDEIPEVVAAPKRVPVKK